MKREAVMSSMAAPSARPCALATRSGMRCPLSLWSPGSRREALARRGGCSFGTKSAPASPARSVSCAPGWTLGAVVWMLGAMLWMLGAAARRWRGEGGAPSARRAPPP
eukprot:698097-Pyramimonas_sp.AAC.1